MSNASLINARCKADNEYYTRYTDVDDELTHYASQLKGKSIYCNCDNPIKSQFVVWFVQHFRSLALKRLIATSYDGLALDIQEADDNVLDGSTCEEMTAWIAERMFRINDGDFRHNLDYLAACDVVVTNPPFSLFREFVALMVEYGKDFLIVGNLNAVTYKGVFPLIKDDRLRLGYNNHGLDFVYSDGSVKHMGFGCWFTTLEIEKSKEPFVLTKTYSPDKYPKYDGYDAIEVSKVADIPYDYDGVMGVPVSFLAKYCNNQFAIVGYAKHGKDSEHDKFVPSVDGEPVYHRLLIEREPNNRVYDNRDAQTPYAWNRYVGQSDCERCYQVSTCSYIAFKIIGILKDGSDGDWDKAKPFIDGVKRFHRILIKVIK